MRARVRSAPQLAGALSSARLRITPPFRGMRLAQVADCTPPSRSRRCARLAERRVGLRWVVRFAAKRRASRPQIAVPRPSPDRVSRSVSAARSAVAFPAACSAAVGPRLATMSSATVPGAQLQNHNNELVKCAPHAAARRRRRARPLRWAAPKASGLRRSHRRPPGPLLRRCAAPHAAGSLPGAAGAAARPAAALLRGRGPLCRVHQKHSPRGHAPRPAQPGPLACARAGRQQRAATPPPLRSMAAAARLAA